MLGLLRCLAVILLDICLAFTENTSVKLLFNTCDPNLVVRGMITTKCGLDWIVLSPRNIRSIVGALEHRVAQRTSELAPPCRKIGIWQFAGASEGR